MAEARAFWIEAPGRGALRTVQLRPPRDGEAAVRALVSAISRGTEALVFHGRVPKSQYEAMHCPFQEGAFPAPVKYGYASVGVVESGPADLAGRRVFCLHPHQDRYVVPADAVRRVPERVPDARAALAANMETALNAIWDGAALPGDRIAVVGAGVVGCLVAALAAQLPGARVMLIDVNPARAPIAARLGCGFAAPEDAPTGRDLVFHASGTSDGLALALTLAGFEATIVELSWYGDRAVAAPLGEAFHSRRLTLKSSQVGEVAPARRARITRAERLDLALSLLEDERYDALLDGACRFAELPAAMAALAEAPGALCRIVRY
jgi:threonine dehydrogenase-like Zn-dependent dehydrogenase